MGTPVATDYEGILGVIRDWPAEKQLDLIREILATIQQHERLYSDMHNDIRSVFGEHFKYVERSASGEATSTTGKVFVIVVDPQKQEASDAGAQPGRKHTLEKALGLLATDHPAPSDAEVEEWLEQQRTEKYG